MTVNIKVGGEAGFGIMAAGQVLLRTFARGGMHGLVINDYPSLVRGGHNVVLVSVSDQPVTATDDTVDVLIALNRETVELHKNELQTGAAVIFDPDSFEVSESDFPIKVTLVPIHLFKIAKDHGGHVLMRNTVTLGATVALLDYDFEFLEKIISDQFKRKGEEVVAKNVAIAKDGYDAVKNMQIKFAKTLHAKKQAPKKIVASGSEAVGLGSIAGGIQFFACYPMTPINGVLTYLASVAEKVGFIYKQPEDEIAAINMAVGASFAGARAMTATSGGGFCLMTEGFSLAGMLEQPVVIIYGQRPGPATGLPTWTTQGDLHFALNAGQGEFPRLVLAPGDIEETFQLTAQAFNLADKYQTPTIVLVDKYLCETSFTADFNKLANMPLSIDRGKLVTEEEQAKSPEFKRYHFSDDGISPRGIPGRKAGIFRANSDEHDEYGYSNEESENAKKMIDKRMQKLTTAQKEVPPAVLYGSKEARHTLVGWGSTKGVALEVLRRFAEKGEEEMVNYLHIAWVNPFPSDSVRYILSHAKHVIDIEGNHNAQMADWIQLKTGITIKDKLTKYDGRPFFPMDVMTYLQKQDNHE
ncbi:2-oxoacid:acceptor oxidoreductase subunit alpha [Candidatus Microgenomates bacterium]|nr:MAG: 2-oxoacid:acceptor oxidoreductase subunit alpha [Candidatus Microgenomates bacterium]